MFLGHFGLAYAAKRAEPRGSLGTYIFAAQLADLLWPILLLVGVEHAAVADAPATPLLNLRFTDYPYSHSLLALIGWGALVGAGVFLVRRRAREALIAGLLVPSHWVLDWWVHVPDLALFPGGSASHGLALWRSLPATLVLEAALFGIGIAVYFLGTRALDRIGRFASWGLVAFLALIYVGSLFGPPPASVRAVALSALALWIPVIWGAWADRHRGAQTLAPAATPGPPRSAPR